MKRKTGVYLRGEVFWVRVQGQTPDGETVRVRRASPAQTSRGAEDYAAAVRRAIGAGQWDAERGDFISDEPEPVTKSTAPRIRDYVEDYVTEQSVTANQKTSTIKSKRGILANWIVPVVGDRRVDEIRTADFTKLRLAMAAKERDGATVNNALTVLSSIVKWWHLQQDLPTPSFRVGMVKVAKQTKAKFYDDKECEALTRSATKLGPVHIALVLLGIDAGLRMSEVRALHWGDLDLAEERPIVVVQRTREDDDESPPKGWKSRTVPLTPRLAKALGQLPRHIKDPHVFLGRWSEPLTRKEIRVRLNAVQAGAGLRETGYHILRHTFCSHLAMRGAPASSIQALAGHADLQTTQRYMHLAPSALDDAIATLGGGSGTSRGTVRRRKTKTGS